jgi:hypothetical protein
MRGRVVRALGSTEEKADIIGPHKWPGFVGERKETLAYGRAATAFLPEGTQGSHCTQPRVGWDIPACLNGSAPGPAIGPALAIQGPRSATNLLDDADGEFSRRVPQTSAEQGKPAAMPLRYRAGQ